MLSASWFGQKFSGKMLKRDKKKNEKKMLISQQLLAQVTLREIGVQKRYHGARAMMVVHVEMLRGPNLSGEAKRKT